VRLAAVGGEERECVVRDASLGGMFLLDESEPPHALELFSELNVFLSGDSGPGVPARVVHVVSADKAQATGLAAGVGLQFEPKRPEQFAVIAAFVDAARRHDPRPRWPLPKPLGDRARASGDPMLGYLLTAVDGTRGPEELSELLGLELDSTDAMLRELAALGLVELVPAGLALPPSARPEVKRSHSRELGSGARAPSPPAPARPRAVPRALSAGLQQELQALERRLPELDHYQVLGLTQGAGREAIRSAYFERSRRFHPDRFYGAALGDDLPRLERVFGRLGEAYGVLGRDGSRAEYDRYLEHKLAFASLATEPPPAQPSAAAGPAPTRASAPRPPELTLRAATLERDPAHPAARLLWESLQDRRERERALAELREQATYEEKHQRWDEAAASWQRLCVAAPDDAQAHQRAALALRHAGSDLGRAIELARRAVELVPTDAQPRRTLGQLYLAQGNKHRARIELETARRLQGTLPLEPPVRS
jgi:curved DNA-binding protein CbpA